MQCLPFLRPASRLRGCKFMPQIVRVSEAGIYLTATPRAMLTSDVRDCAEFVLDLTSGNA
jgi:hypothetical protein